MAVLAFSLYYLFSMQPKSGWTEIPLHPNGVATLVFTKADRGLASVASQEPYTLLSFSKTWQDARRLSSYIDTLAQEHGSLRARSAEWVYRPNGQAAYLEVLEMEGDSLAPEAWLGEGGQYLLRPIREGRLAEPKDGSRLPFVLFWNQYMVFCQEAVALEELVEHPLKLQIERQVPVEVPFGLVLHPERWGSQESSPGLLPFYPVVRMAGEARSLVLLPRHASGKGWEFSGLASRSLKGLRWPTVLVGNAKRGRPQPEDGWQARIGQGMAGNRFMVGADDSLASFRKEIAEQLISVRLVMPPALPSGLKNTRLELSTANPKALADKLRSVFPAADKEGMALTGNLPRQLLGLSMPEFDTCYLSIAPEAVMLASWKPVAAETRPARRLAAGQDLDLQFSPANQWAYLQAFGPRPFQDMQQMLPITLSRLGRIWVNLTGDGIQIALDLLPEPLLGTYPLPAKPFFTNLFNAKLTSFGSVPGAQGMGFAQSENGRMYFYRPGKLSFAQYQAPAGSLVATPVFFREKGWLVWAAGKSLYAVDTLGRTVRGFPTTLPTPVRALTASKGQACGCGTDSAGRGWLYTLSAKGLQKRMAPFSERLSACSLMTLSGKPYAVFESGRGLWRADFSPELHASFYWAEPEITALYGFEGLTGAPTVAGVSREGNYVTRSGGATVRKQLYKPEQVARFEMATLENSLEPYGLVRYTAEAAGFYDLQGRKRWEVPYPAPLRFFRTGSSELGYAALSEGDTLRVFNPIGRLMLQRPGARGARIFTSDRGQGLLAVPEGRELKWFRIGQ